MTSPFKNRLFSLLGLSTASGIWRLLALLFALLNLKRLPFAWHIRVLRGFLTHTKSRTNNPSLLFRPVITSSRTSLLECDYNMHKSNSTYFSDLDISRMHTMMCLSKPGLHKLVREAKRERNATFVVALGGVTCSFKREIKPGQGFEIWTRVLSWDRKWLYLVSHVVEKGKVGPTGYMLQPWKRWVSKGEGKTGMEEEKEEDKVEREGERVHPAILATSIAKYVFKEGRLTIAPETVLRGCDLLTARPSTGLDSPPAATASPAIESTSVEVAAATAVTATMDTLTSSSNAEQVIEAALKPQIDGEEVWDWEKIEAERVRGMKVAEHMAGLDGLFTEFTGNRTAALGEY